MQISRLARPGRQLCSNSEDHSLRCALHRYEEEPSKLQPTLPSTTELQQPSCESQTLLPQRRSRRTYLPAAGEISNSQLPTRRLGKSPIHRPVEKHCGSPKPTAHFAH